MGCVQDRFNALTRFFSGIEASRRYAIEGGKD